MDEQIRLLLDQLANSQDYLIVVSRFMRDIHVKKLECDRLDCFNYEQASDS